MQGWLRGGGVINNSRADRSKDFDGIFEEYLELQAIITGPTDYSREAQDGGPTAYVRFSSIEIAEKS
jgi:hypothetical protein